MRRALRANRLAVLMVVTAMSVSACAKKKVVAIPKAPPPVTSTQPTTSPRAPVPPQPVVENLPVPAEPIAEDAIGNRSLDDLNRASPLKAVFFPLDSSDLDDAGRAVVNANSEVLKKYRTWQVTVEGHCDERGTAEYNLALGERRAVAVKTYLVSLGIAPDRVRTVSYGKEFPFDAGHGEDAWSRNRRAEFVITAK